MTLQGFSSRRCLDVETQVSRHATSVVENLLPRELHRLYRRALGDQGDEDAHEPDGCVRYANDIRPSSPDFPSERRDTQFWLGVRAMNTRSFVVDGRDVVRFFLRLCQIASSIFRQRAQDRSFQRRVRQIASTIPDAPHHFSRPQDSRLFLYPGGGQCPAVLFRRFPKG